MMAEPAFSTEIATALDSYSVPPVPAGFSERLMARIARGDTGTSAAQVGLPAPRPRRASPWRRTSRIVGTLAAFSLATATAVAAGLFGDPVYLPVISEALVNAKIVDAPRPAVISKAQRIAATSAASNSAEPAAAAAPAPLTGSAAIVRRVTELRSDPEFVQLPPRQKRVLAIQEIRQIVRSGEANRQDVRTALRELRGDADPFVDAARRHAMLERLEHRIELREQLAPSIERLEEMPPATPDSQAADPLPSADKDDNLAARATAALLPAKAEALRERYRTATPEQRAAMRNALRERRQLRRQRQMQ